MTSASSLRAARRRDSLLPVSKTLAPIAAPMFVELAVGIAVGIIGVALAARLADASAAAFAMANHIAAMLFILFRIVGAGVGVVITQSIGAGRAPVADATTRAALGAATWIGAFAATAAAAGAAQWFALMNAPSDVHWIGALFLTWLAPSLLLDAWNATLSGVLRARLHNRPVLGVVIGGNLLQLMLAVPLMFGVGSLEGLGLAGFAIAQLLARAATLAAFLWLARSLLDFRPQAKDWFAWSSASLSPVLRIGLPGAAENIGYRLAFMVSLSAVGTLGAAALATQAYVQQVSLVVLMFGLAIGLSMEIAVGHVAGARKLHQADRLLRRALLFALALSIAAATLSALLGPWTLRLFSADETVIASGVTLLWLTVILEPGRTFNLVVINALRATGDARFPVAAGIGSMVVILAGGSWLLGVSWGMGLAGVWVAYIADEWCRGLLMWWRWQSRAWVPHLRATQRGLREAEKRERALQSAGSMPPDGA